MPPLGPAPAEEAGEPSAQLPSGPPVACSSGQGKHSRLKSCFVCIQTERALKGEMGIQSCQLHYLCYQFTNKA